MREKTIERDGQKVVEVRSSGGKLLYVKTEKGYEMKCPRTKELCIVGYDQMFFDCLECFSGISRDQLPVEKVKTIRRVFKEVVQK